MDYQVLTKEDAAYSARLKDRMGAKAPTRLYSRGSLSGWSRFTMAVISSDSISGVALMATNQLLFTIREYAMHYIGGWHSVMENEIFRLGLFNPHVAVTIVTAKGLGKEDYATFLKSRFPPPLDHFPEKKEYFRRSASGELPMVSLTPPQEGRTLEKYVMARNFMCCMLADVVFVPYAEVGSKTFAMVERVLPTRVPVFTTDHESNGGLHLLGVPACTRKNVGSYLERLGAGLPPPHTRRPEPETPTASAPRIAESAQGWLIQNRSRRRKS